MAVLLVFVYTAKYLTHCIGYIFIYIHKHINKAHLFNLFWQKKNILGKNIEFEYFQI